MKKYTHYVSINIKVPSDQESGPESKEIQKSLDKWLEENESDLEDAVEVFDTEENEN